MNPLDKEQMIVLHAPQLIIVKRSLPDGKSNYTKQVQLNVERQVLTFSEKEIEGEARLNAEWVSAERTGILINMDQAEKLLEELTKVIELSKRKNVQESK